MGPESIIESREGLLLLDLVEVLPDEPMDELGCVMNAEFAVDVRAVGLRRIRREVQRRRDLFQTLPTRDKLRDLDLSIGEYVVKRMPMPPSTPLAVYVFSFTNGTSYLHGGEYEGWRARRQLSERDGSSHSERNPNRGGHVGENLSQRL